MNLNQLHARLMAAARSNPPSCRVPHAFERRIMSRLAASHPPNVWALWGRPLWQAALSSLAITALCGLWTLAAPRAPDASGTFAQEFEAAVFAPFNEHLEDAW
jgi:hypothetical protein